MCTERHYTRAELLTITSVGPLDLASTYLSILVTYSFDYVVILLEGTFSSTIA